MRFRNLQSVLIMFSTSLLPAVTREMNKTHFNKLFGSTLNSSEWMIGIALKYCIVVEELYRCRRQFFFFPFFVACNDLNGALKRSRKSLPPALVDVGAVGRLLSYSPLGRIDALGRIDDIKNVTGRELPRTKGWGLTAVQKHPTQSNESIQLVA